MLILAIESSAKPVSVAVYKASDEEGSSGRLLGQYFQNNGFSHSRSLLALVESLLNNLEITLADISKIAVAHGPGSFTGVRIGVSAAKGLAWGLEIPVCGVSTLEAMAYQTFFEDTVICPVMDARREQVYNALFEWRDGTLTRLCDDRVISIKELASDLHNYNHPLLFVGDGVDACITYANRVDESDIFPEYQTTPELLRYQTAYGVALASLNSASMPAAILEPFYLRPSQAEREQKARENNQSGL